MEDLEQTFYLFIQRAFAYADKHQRSQHSQKTWHEHALEFCRQTFTTISVGMEYMLKEMIENPHLILADIRVYRDHVQTKGHCFKDPELPKCSSRAAELRRIGNHLYELKTFESALEKYNESICSAPSDSEDLGIGYANRSAIYIAREEYELALANIELAKKNNYPERLMPKLLQREINCQDKLVEYSLTGKVKKRPTLTFNSEANPRIPFLSKGISAKQLPIYGNSLVAEKSFKAGDIILLEKPLKTCVGMTRKFIHCNHCLSGNLLHLMPCPNCTSAMFCNEQCLHDGFKMHRFECGATAKLVKLNDLLLGPKMFFHGLTLFDDDVEKLMEFCQSKKETDKSFFDLDYCNHDLLEEFKIFISLKNRTIPKFSAVLKMNAAIYYSIFMEIPLVRSLITTKAHKDFMVQCFFDYMYLKIGMEIYGDSTSDMNGQLYPIASICNHSCDPNTLALDYGGQMKFVVLRPISRDEQILVSYGPHFNQPPVLRKRRLNETGFNCACEVCDKNKRKIWMAKHVKKNSIPLTDLITFDEDVTDAHRMESLQQFVQRYFGVHPQREFALILDMYAKSLVVCNKQEIDDTTRKTISGWIVPLVISEVLNCP